MNLTLSSTFLRFSSNLTQAFQLNRLFDKSVKLEHFAFVLSDRVVEKRKRSASTDSDRSSNSNNSSGKQSENKEGSKDGTQSDGDADKPKKKKARTTFTGDSAFKITEGSGCGEPSGSA